MELLQRVRLLALSLVLALPCAHAATQLAGQDGPGQSVQARGLLAFRQALLDASSDVRVVLVATHPDDPYRALSLMLRRRWGCDVTVLLATRGEGGQNAVGPQQGAALARIRTREAVTAAAALDVKLRFLDFADFGYSRSAKEALDVWRGEHAYRLLRARVLELDPDLILTIHGPDEAHGQKRAVVQLLERLTRDEAAKRFRVFRAVAKDGREAPDVLLDFELPDPTSGESYRRQSYRILGYHRTQAPRRPFREAIPERLAMLSIGRGQAKSLFAGLPSMWTHAEQLAARMAAQGTALDLFELRRLLESLPQCSPTSLGAGSKSRIQRALACLSSLASCLGSPAVGQPRLTADLRTRLGRRVEALEQAVRLGAQIQVDWVGGTQALWLHNGRVAMDLGFRNGGVFDVSVETVELLGMKAQGLALVAAAGRLHLAAGQRKQMHIEVVAAEDCRIPREGLDLVLQARLLVSRLGSAAAQSSGPGTWSVPLHATLARRLHAQRRVSLYPVPEARYLVPENGGRVRLSLEVEKPIASDLRAILALSGPPGLRFLPGSQREELPIRIQLSRGSRRLRVPLQIVVPAWTKQPARARDLRFYLRDERGRRGAGSPRAKGQGLEQAHCKLRLEAVQIRLPAKLRIGLVRGPDTTIEESLASLGLEVRELDPRTLARAALDDYDTIVIDSRALLRRREDLVPQVPLFVNYARRGKHLVVLYHKPQEFNADKIGALLAPFPLELGTERVTREDAPVTMLVPEHALLSWPNRIRSRDWDGWVQERGLYFPKLYDRRYTELLSIRELSMREGPSKPENVMDFKPQRSSLLAAKVGRGTYVYCALVLHRQLRNLHPGAARLLVNLVTPPGWERLRR